MDNKYEYYLSDDGGCNIVHMPILMDIGSSFYAYGYRYYVIDIDVDDDITFLCERDYDCAIDIRQYKRDINIDKLLNNDNI